MAVSSHYDREGARTHARKEDNHFKANKENFTCRKKVCCSTKSDCKEIFGYKKREKIFFEKINYDYPECLNNISNLRYYGRKE